MNGKAIVGMRMDVPSTSATATGDKWRVSWLQPMAIAPKPPTLAIVIQTLTIFSSSPDCR
jgi:hypothetical protein